MTRPRTLVNVLALPLSLAVAVFLAVVGCGAQQGRWDDLSDRAGGVATRATPVGVPEGPPGRPSGGRGGIEDGELPDGATVYDDLPGVSGLRADLREVLRAATADAAAQGVRILVTSGWRSAAYQSRLFEEAVAEHGSEAAAAVWVARPGTSVHEQGAAVDVGPRAATDWLAEHGAGYGLCRVYDNEPWHFELDPGAPDDGCPEPYDDPAEDPRLQ